MLEPRTDWKETIDPGEEAILLKHAETLRDLQRAQAKKGMGRALHRKSHGGVLAEVRVRPDLPAHLRVGMFAEPRTYPGYVRFSNGSNATQQDGKGDVRGVALKVVGVGGKKLIPGMEDAKTQDFLLIKSPSTPFRNATEFVGVVEGAAKPWKLLGLGAAIGFGRLFGILKQLTAGLKEPVTTMAGLTYYSALPIRFGDHAAHYSLRPATPIDTAPRGSGPHALRDDLAARLAEADLRYELRVQLYVDPVKTPIEDASVEWKESDSPFVAVADVVLPKQDMKSARGQKIDAYVEKLSFDPWHAAVELRPLGNMMRARNHAYRLSVIERGASPEPDGTETFEA
jgi:hypothetical protein